jgi:hypothetical protein
MKTEMQIAVEKDNRQNDKAKAIRIQKVQLTSHFFLIYFDTVKLSLYMPIDRGYSPTYFNFKNNCRRAISFMLRHQLDTRPGTPDTVWTLSRK